MTDWIVHKKILLPDKKYLSKKNAVLFLNQKTALHFIRNPN